MPAARAAGTLLVEPGRAVGAEAPRQHVPLPDLRAQGDALKRHERLPQTVGARTRWAVGVHVLPARKEASQLARLDRLGLGSKVREACAPEAAQHVGVAPFALGSAGEQLTPYELANAFELAERRGGIHAVARSGLLGREGAVGARVAAHERRHGLRDPLQERIRQPRRWRNAERIAVERGVLGRDPALLAPDAHSRRSPLAFELLEHRRGRVALGDALLALGRGQVAEPPQDLLEGVPVLRARRLDPVLQRVDHLRERARVDQLAQLLLAEQLAEELPIE